MSRIIEICGAPGSGKTTTYKALNRIWEKSFNWLLTEYPRKRIIFSNPKKFLISLKHWVNKERDNKALDEAGQRFVAQFPDYIDQFWSSHFFKSNDHYHGVDLRFRNVNVYWSTLRKIQYLREIKSEKIYVACEGLIQRIGNGWYKSRSVEEDKQEAFALLNLMPLPEAVVYLEVGIEHNVKRIQTRPKMLPAHKDLSTADLEQITRNNHERWHYICSTLEEKGIPLLKLDSSHLIEENSKKISLFAHQIFKGISDVDIIEESKKVFNTV